MTAGNKAEDHKGWYKTKERNVSEIIYTFQTIRKAMAFNPFRLHSVSKMVSGKVRLLATGVQHRDRHLVSNVPSFHLYG